METVLKAKHMLKLTIKNRNFNNEEEEEEEDEALGTAPKDENPVMFAGN